MGCNRDELLVETSERLKAMRTQEATHYAVPDYLAAEWQRQLREAPRAQGDDGPSPSASGAASPPSSSAASVGNDTQIDELWRDRICEWCYRVVDHFNSDREIVAVALSYLDRYLATRIADRRMFQLSAMTALYLASKLYEPCAGRIRLTSFVELSMGHFASEHVVAMEISMLHALRWHVHPPTPYAFCRELAPLVPEEIRSRTRHGMRELAKFLTELSLCDYWFVGRKPSSVALAATMNAFDLRGSRRLGPGRKAEFLRRVGDAGLDAADDPEILECYERLRELYVAGEYAPDLEDDADGRVRGASPDGVMDGPDASGSTDDDCSEMECA